MADRHRIRKPIEPPSERFRLSEAERQEQLDMLCPPPRALMPEPLTIDQLRAYLEQRERESGDATESRRLIYHDAKGTPHERRRWTAYIILGARHSLYRELLDAIEKGELPDA